MSRFLIHQVVCGCCPIVSCVPPLLTLDFPILAKYALCSFSISAVIVFVSCQLYFGQLHSNINEIYFMSNSLMVRISRERHIHMTIKLKLKEEIKALVCNKQPVGFTFGNKTLPSLNFMPYKSCGQQSHSLSWSWSRLIRTHSLGLSDQWNIRTL